MHLGLHGDHGCKHLLDLLVQLLLKRCSLRASRYLAMLCPARCPARSGLAGEIRGRWRGLHAFALGLLGETGMPFRRALCRESTFESRGCRLPRDLSGRGILRRQVQRLDSSGSDPQAHSRMNASEASSVCLPKRTSIRYWAGGKIRVMAREPDTLT